MLRMMEKYPGLGFPTIVDDITIVSHGVAGKAPAVEAMGDLYGRYGRTAGGRPFCWSLGCLTRWG